MRQRTALFLFATTATACAAKPDAPSDAAGTAERPAIEAAMARYSRFIKDGPVDSTVAQFAPDGQLLEPGMAALAGRKAIADFLGPLASQFSVDSATMTTDELDVRGDVAYQWGRYFQRAGPKGQPGKPYQGRFVAGWVKAGGAWRIRRLLMQPG